MDEEKSEESGGEKGLDNFTIIKMVVVAVFFDFLQFILGFIWLGWLVGIFAGLTFWFWFNQHGISFIKNPKRLMAFGGASIIEMLPIPLLADLPAWTAAIVYLALDSKVKKVVKIIPGASLVEKSGIIKK